CARTCNKLFKCDPFYVSPVYSIINGVCRLFNNHCVFGTINCDRINQCLKPYEATTKEECQKACPRMCLMGGSGVCATFYYFNNKGVRIEVKRSFENQCILDSYCCATD
ncbi:CG42823, partial [Drosophila busckii]